MLSYRHAFHAGNHADVLKHFVLVQVLRYLGQKDKPFFYIDTHAGAGCYALDRGYATQNGEAETGIRRLWTRKDLPAPLADYVDQVRAVNPGGTLRLYPGSPLVAEKVLALPCRLRLFEMHSSDLPALERQFRDFGSRAMVQGGDGFAGLKALLPPPPRRAAVLIDPSYEQKQDYQRVVVALKDALTRFATGTYLVWYPLLRRPEVAQLVAKLKRLPAKDWLNVSLTVKAPEEDGFGMTGSGMFILNPPWTLAETLDAVMPYLVSVLGQDAAAGFLVEQGAGGEGPGAVAPAQLARRAPVSANRNAASQRPAAPARPATAGSGARPRKPRPA